MEPRGGGPTGVERHPPKKKAVKDDGEVGPDGPLEEGGCHHFRVAASPVWHFAMASRESGISP